VNPAPLCSIVIPVHNRAALTAQCIDTILADPPGAPLAIIVSDDASTDATAEVLRRYEEPVRTVRSERNGGFATACNAGAEAARGTLLVFLNNDTVPMRGWLDALVAEAEQHGDAAVIGAKLLFPNDTVQHAGVVICLDRNPRHLYAGFPADHPAVNKSRRFQAVTAACMMVRRAAFEAAGGFDDGYRNSLEDVDLCLRIAAVGHAVRLCHTSVLYHLESASRGRRSQEIEHSRRLFARRWRDKVEPDDLSYYLEDGLISFGYRDSYPLTMEVSPLLAVMRDRERAGGRMIELQAAQVGSLLRETVRLTSHVAELELETSLSNGGGPGIAPGSEPKPERRAPDGARITPEIVEALSKDVSLIELAILDFQSRVAAAVRGRKLRWRETKPFSPGGGLAYRSLKAGLQQAVVEHIPHGATVLVISRGDEELLELGDRKAWHFPRDEDGGYTGYHPKDSNDAIERLEALRDAGAQWLVIPEPSLWWMKHYRKFARRLRDRYELISDDDAGKIFRLDVRAS
jgi:GT2 family glycosyltransferase